MHLRSRTSRLALVVAALSGTIGAVAAAEAAPAGVTAPRDVAAAQPVRILDTRIGLGAQRLTPNGVTTLQVPGDAVAGDASSILLNLTATNASANGFVRAWPCAEPMPPTSSLNFSPGRNSANASVVRLDDRSVCLSSNVAVDLVADVQGWTTGANDFIGTAPSRLLDTRITGDPLRAGQEKRLTVAGAGGIPADAAQVALNVTVDDPTGAGYVAAYPCGQPTNGSTVNFNGGDTVANLAFVAIGGGDVCFVSSIATPLIVDSFGWSPASSSLRVQSPSRLLDSRDAAQWVFGNQRSTSTIRLRVAGRAGVPNGARSALVTVTVARPQGDGFVTVWSCDQSRPTASTVNTFPNAFRSNVTLVDLSEDGMACLYYEASNGSPTDIVVDAVGWIGDDVRRDPPTGVGDVLLTGPKGCNFSSGVFNVAFCDTFDAPAANPLGSRSGDLDGTVWGVSRTNTVDSAANLWFPAPITHCGPPQAMTSPADVRVCNGRVFEAATDGTGQTTLALYPKQPFDIAGRTGTIVFDVNADSEGPHAAWPEFWWTDQPVPAPHGHMASQAPYARNSFGFTLAQPDYPCNGGESGVNSMIITRNYVEQEIPFTKVDCVTKGSALGALNHFEVRISESHVEVWGTDPGASQLKLLATADVQMPLNRGVIWLEDVHYNGNKFNTQGTHMFAWDNVGFDGPTPYRDLTFDVADNTAAVGGGIGLGHKVTQAPTTLTAPGVYWMQQPTKAYVMFNFMPYSPVVPSVSINGGPWHDMAWPFDGEGFAWRTIAVEVPMSEVRSGDNTISFRSGTAEGTTVANINLALIAAAPVPAS